MERLPLTDAGWLLAEGRERPMHVGGLLLFDPPANAPEYLGELVEEARAVTVQPPFDRRLVRPYGRAGLFHWERDPATDLEYHVRHLALPHPGRIRELLAFVGQVHGSLLDRHRPLWEAYLIEGLEDGRVALYTKVHHSLLDGVAAMRQMLRSFSPDPAARSLPPPWAPATRPRRTIARDGTDAGPLAAIATAGRSIRSSWKVGRALRDQYRQARRQLAPVAPFQAPRSILNVPLTAARRFVAQSYDLARIRAVADATDSTVNDVALAMCGAALRHYLLDQSALPDDPLVAMVPVSIRPADADDGGNALAMLLANLGTNVADDVERLTIVRESMRTGKARLRAMTQSELDLYGILMFSPILVGEVLGISARTPPMYNVVISNVPGPDEPLYWNGARLEGVYPVSLLSDGYALNITLLSYAGSIEFGIVADRAALPSVQRLIDHLEDALAALEAATG